MEDLGYCLLLDGSMQVEKAPKGGGMLTDLMGKGHFTSFVHEGGIA